MMSSKHLRGDMNYTWPTAEVRLSARWLCVWCLVLLVPVLMHHITRKNHTTQTLQTIMNRLRVILDFFTGEGDE